MSAAERIFPNPHPLRIVDDIISLGLLSEAQGSMLQLFEVTLETSPIVSLESSFREHLFSLFTAFIDEASRGEPYLSQKADIPDHSRSQVAKISDDIKTRAYFPYSEETAMLRRHPRLATGQVAGIFVGTAQNYETHTYILPRGRDQSYYIFSITRNLESMKTDVFYGFPKNFHDKYTLVLFISDDSENNASIQKGEQPL